MSRTIVLFLTVALMGSVAIAQTRSLYLLTGSVAYQGGSSNLSEAELFAISSPGSLRLVRKVASDGRGVKAILPASEQGTIFLALPASGPQSIEAIAFSSPEVVRRYSLETDQPGLVWVPFPSPIRQALRPHPHTVLGLDLAVVETNTILFASVSDGIRLTTAAYAWQLTPPGLTARTYDEAALAAGRRVPGTFGFRGLGSQNIAQIQFEAGSWSSGRSKNPVGLAPVPGHPPNERSHWSLLARNENAAVIRLMNAPHLKQPSALVSPAFASTWLYRQSTQKWEPLNSPGGRNALIRLIGPWLLLVAGDEKRGRVSPGTAGQRSHLSGRNTDAATRPSTSERFALMADYYPGLLIAIDTRNGRTWQIATNQGDSELLLVDNTTAYYRVNDRILKAELLDAGRVGPPTQLAQHDDLRDAHWAFLGPAK